MTHSTRISSLHLLESGNVESEIFTWPDLPFMDGQLRLLAIVQLWNDKRLTDLLDAAIAADNGEPLQ